MTEKEKAKAYDEVLKKAKKWHNIPNPIYCNIITEKIFPELKESEDEEIRKEIISILRNAYWTSNRNRFNKLVAWLEKQGDKSLPQTNERAWLYLVSDVLTWKDGIGQYLDDPRVQELAKRLCSEYAQKLYNSSILSNSSNTGKNEQKSVDKIEPRFKVGDWIITPENKVLQITSIEGTSYRFNNESHYWEFCYCDEQCHLWTIEDAKDGDVLALSWLEDKNLWEKIIIFKKYHSEGVKGICSMPCVEGYGNTFKNGKMAFTEKVPYYSKTKTYNLHPATKEQRNQKKKKIKEAGYEWDTEKKELKELVEPKFKVGDKIVNVPMKYWGAPVTQGTILKITDDKYIFTDGSRMSISNQDSWELASNKKPKFDPKTLQPFDRVLARDYDTCKWKVDFYSYKEEGNRFPYICMGNNLYKQCIPYNDDTKHLVGTNEEAPEYYRYWEE